MFTEKEWDRFYSLRQRVFNIIKDIDEGYHKSYEGAVDVRICFNNVYEAKDVKDVSSVEIELHCYLMVNGRHITWYGKTFTEALDKFECWVDDHESPF